MVRGDYDQTSVMLYHRTGVFCSSSLLLEAFDAHIEVCWFHKPVVLARPLSIWMLQFEIEVAHDLWHELGHLQI